MRHIWTEQEIDFLRKHYPRSTKQETLVKKFHRQFGWKCEYNHICDAARRYCIKKRKDTIAKIKRSAIQKCLDKRGGDEFCRRMSERASSGLYFGGKHHNGPSLTREQLQDMARKNFTKEVRDRAHSSRKKTVKRERLRMNWGLDQITKLNLTKKPCWMTWARYNLKKKYRYITFRDDDDIFYDDNTIRSEKTEKHYEGRGMNFYHITQRGQKQHVMAIRESSFSTFLPEY